MTKKAIGLEEFNTLPLEHKLNILHVDGAYVGKRNVDGQVATLYQLYGFYVEVYYKKYRSIIDRMRTSDKTDILQPYISQVHVRDLPHSKEETID